MELLWKCRLGRSICREVSCRPGYSHSEARVVTVGRGLKMAGSARHNPPSPDGPKCNRARMPSNLSAGLCRRTRDPTPFASQGDCDGGCPTRPAGASQASQFVWHRQQPTAMQRRVRESVWWQGHRLGRRGGARDGFKKKETDPEV
jgi:hypothetical protein